MSRGASAELRAALALAAVPGAILGAVIGSAMADALALDGADARLVAVTLGIALPLAALRVARPGSSRRTRVLFAALSLPMLPAVAAPRAAWWVALLCGGALLLIGDATVHATRTALALTRSPARFALGAVALAPCVYFGASAFVVLFNTQLIVLPARLSHGHPLVEAGERTIELVAEDGVRLGATYTPGRRGAPGVVLAHGVSDGRTRFVPWAERLRARGWHALRFDFRAHGTSEGAVCTYGQREAADVRAAVDALRAMDGVDPERIAVVGASMGGGSVLAAAPSLPARGVRALVLLAPASRYPPLVEARVRVLGPLASAVMGPSGQLARAAGQIPMTRWVPADRLARAPSLPVLVMHGDRDATIPLGLSRRLVRERNHSRGLRPPARAPRSHVPVLVVLARAPGRAELVVVRGAGHDELSNVIASSDALWSHVERFLESELGELRGSSRGALRWRR